MHEIQQQVRRVRRRLNGQTLLGILVVSLTICLSLALLGLAIPRLMVLPVDQQIWTWSWIGGGAAVGLLSGGILAWLKRRSDLQAAVELDQRFGLKERVSSSLALSPAEQESEVGQALLADTQRRVERVDIREHFRWGFNIRALLPLIPAIAMFLLVYFVPPATQEATAAPGGVTEEKARIKKAVAELEQRLADRREALKDKQAGESEEVLNELARSTEKLQKTELDNQKDALVKLNELAKDVEKRRDELLPSEKLKEQMKQLEGMKKLEEGPADKLASDLRDGKLGDAAQEMKKLLEKLKNNELTREEQNKMAEQLEKVQQKLQQLKQDHEARKQELKEKIEQQKQQGNQAEAAKMQEELEKLQAQDDQMKKGCENMAQKLAEAAKNLKEGNGQQAAEDLQQLAEELQGQQDQLDELETLEEAMNEIEDAKRAMGCKECQGEGCKECKGGGGGKGGKKPGDGLGEGQGYGDRPEEKTDTKGYDSRVRAKPKQGAAVRIGNAGGANLPGKVQEGIKEQLEAALSSQADPIDETALPRDQREHSKEYFEKLLQE